jgi:N6-L-threonylcarbamoyladenine synthase
MTILAIESSCDETSAAIVSTVSGDTNPHVISHATASSLTLHARTGGVIPEIAAREQLRTMIPVINDVLIGAGMNWQNPEIDLIAVTKGPGLIGSLVIGIETARALSYVWNIPLMGVNHLFGHLYASFLGQHPVDNVRFPAVGCIASGAHTDLVWMENIHQITWVGGTRDDAAGEALDKIGRTLGIPYPAGATIEQRASRATKTHSITLPHPYLPDDPYTFSFSGLKTAALRVIEQAGDVARTDSWIDDMCFTLQQTIIRVLTRKILALAIERGAASIIIGGGVSANTTLISHLSKEAQLHGMTVYSPLREYCTDNAAMIGSAAFFHPEPGDWRNISADPTLSIP